MFTALVTSGLFCVTRPEPDVSLAASCLLPQDPLARVGDGGPRRLVRAVPLAPSAPLLAPRVACLVAAGGLLWWHLCHQAWELPLTPLPEQVRLPRPPSESASVT